MINWKAELTKLLKSSCSDSDIEDFLLEHPNVNGRKIWNFVYEYIAPAECKGCEHIQYSGSGMFPCNQCSRRVKVQDYYKKR